MDKYKNIVMETGKVLFLEPRHVRVLKSEKYTGVFENIDRFSKNKTNTSIKFVGLFAVGFSIHHKPQK